MSILARDVLAIEALINTSNEPGAGVGRALVHHFGSLRALLVSRRGELIAAGVSAEGARRIAATRRLAATLVRRRRSRRLLSPRLVLQLVPHLAWHPVEEVWLIPVDATLRALGCMLIARGNAASCAVTPDEIFGPALRHRARGVFVVHNHPSGDPTPSAADLVFTERLQDAARLLSVRVEEQQVAGGGRFASVLSRRCGAMQSPSWDGPLQRRPRGPVDVSAESVEAR